MCCGPLHRSQCFWDETSRFSRSNGDSCPVLQPRQQLLDSLDNIGIHASSSSAWSFTRAWSTVFRGMHGAFGGSGLIQLAKLGTEVEGDDRGQRERSCDQENPLRHMLSIFLVLRYLLCTMRTSYTSMQSALLSAAVGVPGRLRVKRVNMRLFSSVQRACERAPCRTFGNKF